MHIIRHNDNSLCTCLFNSSQLMVLIWSSFPMLRDPTAQAVSPLHRYSGKTPAAPALARKLFARCHSAGETNPARDCRRPPPEESRLSAVQAVAKRYTDKTLPLQNHHPPTISPNSPPHPSKFLALSVSPPHH